MVDEKPWKVVRDGTGESWSILDRATGKCVGEVARYDVGAWLAWAENGRSLTPDLEYRTRAEAAALVYQAWIEAPHE